MIVSLEGVAARMGEGRGWGRVRLWPKAWASASIATTTSLLGDNLSDVVVVVEAWPLASFTFSGGSMNPIPLRVVGKIVNKKDAKIPAPSGKLIMT